MNIARIKAWHASYKQPTATLEKRRSIFRENQELEPKKRKDYKYEKRLQVWIHLVKAAEIFGHIAENNEMVVAGGGPERPRYAYEFFLDLSGSLTNN